MDRLNLVFASVLLLVAMVASQAAFADVEIIDFDAMMQTISLALSGIDSGGAQFDPLIADNNNNGILDATEFAVLSAVFADTSYAFHDTLHEAYKANYAQIFTEWDSAGYAFFDSIMPELRIVLAAYVTLGDGSYTLSPDVFVGSWGFFAALQNELVGPPNDVDYDFQNTLASACGDFDRDGVSNLYEFNGQGGDRTRYVAAALDSLTTTDGRDPDGVCGPASPDAQFSADVTYGCAPLEVNFTDLSEPGAEPPIISWSWDFDGNGVEDYNGQNPSYTYETPGVYDVRLTVTNAHDVASITKSAFITVTGPDADFEANTTLGIAPLTVTFLDQTTGCLSGITDWSWDFDGDGVEDYNGQTPPPQTYSEAGVYTVSLAVSTASDSNGETKPAYIEVMAAEVDFDADSYSVCVDTPINFTDNTSDCGGAITLYEWDFDNDGIVDDTTQNPSYRYDTPGVYDVRLTITNGYGVASITKSAFITITGPDADFEVDTTWGMAPLTVTFLDQTTGCLSGITDWSWDFNGDGVEDYNGQTPPPQTYSEAGVYAVSLSVSTAGWSDTETKVAYIKAGSIIRVDRDSSAPAPDGSTWEKAFSTIQAGIDAISLAGGGEIWVAEGVYTGNGRTVNLGGIDTENIIALAMDVHLYGGFNGTEIARVDRDWQSNSTIIDGENTRRCVIAQAIGESVTILDGFTIRNGKTATGDFEIVCMGGGMLNLSSSPVVTNCTFAGNAAVAGGGMSNEIDSSPVITNCVFAGNAAVAGGGMLNGFASSPVVTNCVFAENAANSSGGDGGGMCNGIDSSPELINCIFSGNTADHDGAGIYNFASSLALTNCTFSGNAANNNAGGIYSHGSSLVVTNCILWGNTPDEIHEEGSSTSEVRYSDVQGGFSGVGNINSDPLFINAPDDLRVESTSPCVDAGMAMDAPACDIRGVARPQQSGYDMGAYEYKYDVVLPTAVITRLTASPTGADTVEFEVAFSESVAPSFNANDVSLAGSLAGAVSIRGADPTYTVAVTLDDPSADGAVGIVIADGGAITDVAGNPYAGDSSTLCNVFNWRGFAQQPQHARKYAGEAHTFTVVADCDASALSYQWKWNDGLDKAIQDVGTDSPTYTISDVVGMAGDYWCEISYADSTYSSASVPLEVEEHLSIIKQPVGGDYTAGDTHTFTVMTTGGYAPLFYTWKKDDETVSTDASYTIESLAESDSGVYTVEILDDNGDVVVSSPAVELMVAPAVPASGLIGLGILLSGLTIVGLAEKRKKK